MSKKNVVFVNGDDWQGAYIDGRLIYQHHAVPEEQVMKALGYGEKTYLEALGHTVQHVWASDLASLRERGYFPDSLDAVLAEMQSVEDAKAIVAKLEEQLKEARRALNKKCGGADA